MYLSKTVPGSLMAEHGLILRMVGDLKLETVRLSAGGALDADYVVTAVDFLRSYADRCHHGKEEDILFRDLGTKDLAPGDAQAMADLMADHAWARGRTARLVERAAAATMGDPGALADTASVLGELADFYPIHIAKEDRSFFRVAMGYLAPEERQAMADEFAAFDRALIHERYSRVVDEVTARRNG